MQKHKCYIILLFVFTASVVTAQFNRKLLKEWLDTDKVVPSGYCAVNIGWGIPAGNFGYDKNRYSPGPTTPPSNSYGIGYGGYARSNVSLVASGGYIITHSLGVACMGGYYSNYFDAGMFFLNDMDPQPPQPGGVEILSSSSTLYKEYDFLGGLYVTDASKKISYDFRFLAGPVICISPAGSCVFTSYSPNGTYKGTASITSGKSISTAFDIGGDMRIKLIRKWCLVIATDCVFTRASFHVNYSNYPWGPYKFTSLYTIFNFSCGICYNIRS